MPRPPLPSSSARVPRRWPNSRHRQPRPRARRLRRPLQMPRLLRRRLLEMPRSQPRQQRQQQPMRLGQWRRQLPAYRQRKPIRRPKPLRRPMTRPRTMPCRLAPTHCMRVWPRMTRARPQFRQTVTPQTPRRTPPAPTRLPRPLSPTRPVPATGVGLRDLVVVLEADVGIWGWRRTSMRPAVGFRGSRMSGARSMAGRGPVYSFNYAGLPTSTRSIPVGRHPCANCGGTWERLSPVPRTLWRVVGPESSRSKGTARAGPHLWLRCSARIPVRNAPQPPAANSRAGPVGRFESRTAKRPSSSVAAWTQSLPPPLYEEVTHRARRVSALGTCVVMRVPLPPS